MNHKLVKGLGAVTAATLLAASFAVAAQVTPSAAPARHDTMPADHAMPGSDASTASDPFVKMDKDGDGAISKAEATGKL
ncbi:MAG: EF-hand domain-containing protein, partial [Solimonas sp.]